jgi:hypothetical protein
VRRTLALVALAAPLSGAPDAAAAEFVDVANSDEVAIAMNLDSISRHKGGVQAVIRQTRSAVNSVSIKRVTIREADCRRGHGSFLMSDLDGQNRVWLSWAEGTGDLTSTVGEVLCTWVRIEKDLLT